MKNVLILVLLAAAGLGAAAAENADIFTAVKNGDLAAVRSLLEKNPGLVDEADRYTLTPLHWAAYAGRRQVAELLLARGARIDRKTRLGRSALIIAVQHRHPDVADLLREKGAEEGPWVWPRLTGEYIGEAPPGPVPRLFAPEIVSSAIFDHSAPAFSRDGREVFWAVVFADDTGVLMGMRMEGDAWGEIKPLPFSEARFRDICPLLSADGTTLCFTSCRPAQETDKAGAYNMWAVDQEAGGWSAPRLLAPEIASGMDARPVFARDGTMYFGSWREGARDGTNIFFSRRVDGKYAAPRRLDAPFNAGNAMPTWIAPDESFLIFESFRPGGLGGSDFWTSARRADGTWGPAVNLGEPVNSSGNDWFGGFSPDGKYFFFVSDRGGDNDVYWVDAAAIAGLRGSAVEKPATPLWPHMGQVIKAVNMDDYKDLVFFQ